MRHAAVAAVALLALALPACGSTRAQTRLTVDIQSGAGAGAKHERFTLRCRPTGGTMPHAAALCALVAGHPQAMLHPGPAQMVCDAVAGLPAVSVTGTSAGRRVAIPNLQTCTQPGGDDALAYWAAANSPGRLAAAAAALRRDS